LGIYAALADREKADVIAEFAGRQFSEFKAVLTELAVAKLGPVATEMQRLMKDPGHVDKVLHNGAERARALGDPLLADVYRTVGFLKP
jgi:tryptophanyl-tRNA synthetase